jgi:hypothetical protein
MQHMLETCSKPMKFYHSMASRSHKIIASHKKENYSLAIFHYFRQ